MLLQTFPLISHSYIALVSFPRLSYTSQFTNIQAISIKPGNHENEKPKKKDEILFYELELKKTIFSIEYEIFLFELYFKKKIENSI